MEFNKLTAIDETECLSPSQSPENSFLQPSPTKLTITKTYSNKGKFMLIVNGYNLQFLNFNRKKAIKFWRCTNRSCNVILHTNSDDTFIRFSGTITAHNDNQNAHGLSVRELADNYKISKSSAANILRRSEELLADYSSNCNKEKARQVAEQLGYTSETFKASNGWLKKFRNRYAISFRTINGESALVDNSTVEEWTQRLSTILDGFDENDVFNADETGLSYRATPDHSLVLSKEESQTADQISITVLDAIKWIDLSWENVTEKTIKNGFRAL
ncbi:unnamed protein product [Rotaria magnacalcarata]|uniref:HTH CENPB-type domain-containing protein n=1 Tax=Rotaria magnacalcarata TaxID=392030 RepID=A0A8S2QNR7_9BILA|nr:unnamed protein product [Rotaria magnacalcarata]